MILIPSRLIDVSFHSPFLLFKLCLLIYPITSSLLVLPSSPFSPTVLTVHFGVHIFHNKPSQYFTFRSLSRLPPSIPIPASLSPSLPCSVPAFLAFRPSGPQEIKSVPHGPQREHCLLGKEYHPTENGELERILQRKIPGIPQEIIKSRGYWREKHSCYTWRFNAEIYHTYKIHMTVCVYIYTHNSFLTFNK